ncbi:MAG: GcrA cell cycle regulator [Alphaproteobacteria bacterium]|nr:GcrA cell cycle regulator [Alphaproteobacteria bacterium]
MSWTDERVELLKKLWMEGLSASQIANELGDGVTRNAVIGKVHRLKLSARAKPASTAPRPRAANRPTVHRAPTGGSVSQGIKRRVMHAAPTIGATALKPSEDFAIEHEPELADVHELLIPESERLSLLDLNEHTCKWPIGDPLNPDFHFCGRPPKDDHPYCEFHARRAYHQVDKKRR